MSDDYQLRKDVDKLNDLAWNTIDGQSKLLNKDTFFDYKEEVENTYVDNDKLNVRLSEYVEKENGKGLFSGSYSDLSDKPSYSPTVTSSTTDSYKIGSVNISGSDVDIYGKDTDTVYTHPSAKQCNYSYTHPSAKQCNASIPSDVSDLTDTQNTAFTPKTHTHTKSEVTDFSHTHTKSEITDFPNLNYTLVQEPFTIATGVTVRVYANDLNVYVKFRGTATLTANTNSVSSTSISEPYRPYAPTNDGYYEYGLIGHSNANIYGAVNDNGNVYIINKTSSTSSIVYGSIMYPLKARMP